MSAEETANGSDPLAGLFTGLVPDELDQAYRRLLNTGGIPAGDAPSELGGQDIVTRLASLGMAKTHSSYGQPLFLPASPSLALQGVLGDLIGRMKEHQEQLQTGIERAIHAHGLDCASNGIPPHETFKLYTDRKAITQASIFLINSARRDWMAIDISARDTKLNEHSHIQPPERIRKGIRRRCLYDEAFTKTEEGRRHIQQCLAAGEEARFLPSLPMRMQLADDTAVLLPTSITGMAGAIMFHAEPIVAAMRMLFELLWDMAHPLSGPDPERDNHLDQDHQLVLDLLARGHEHKQIAAETGLGKSTVDHYAQDICKTLGARNRVHAVALAVHRGWIDWTAAIPAQRTKTRSGKPRPTSR